MGLTTFPENLIDEVLDLVHLGKLSTDPHIVAGRDAFLDLWNLVVSLLEIVEHLDHQLEVL